MLRPCPREWGARWTATEWGTLDCDGVGHVGLFVGLSGWLVAEKLLRHEQRGVGRRVCPPRARAARVLRRVRRLRVLLMLGVAFRRLGMRAGRDAIFVTGLSPPCAGVRGARRRARSFKRASVDAGDAGGAGVHHGAETNSKVVDAPQPPTCRAKCRVMTPKNRG